MDMQVLIGCDGCVQRIQYPGGRPNGALRGSTEKFFKDFCQIGEQRATGVRCTQLETLHVLEGGDCR